MSDREMTSLELVEAFERESGAFDGPSVNVSPPHPGIVPTWPRLIRERALAEAAPPALDGLRAKVDALRGMAWERPEGWVNFVDRAAVLAIIDALAEPAQPVFDDEEASLAYSALGEAIRMAATLGIERVPLQAPLARYLFAMFTARGDAQVSLARLDAMEAAATFGTCPDCGSVLQHTYLGDRVPDHRWPR